MTSETPLFPELDQLRGLMPVGFRYEEDVISEADEAALPKSLATLDLKPFEFHGHLGNRRVTSFGLRYDYARRAVKATDGFPAFVADLRNKVAKFAGRKVDEFQQGGVNQYPPGAGIGWHKDKPQFVSSSAFRSWPQRLCASVVRREQVGSGRLGRSSRARSTFWKVRCEPHGSIVFRQWIPCDIL
jgi:hypothetical protein